MPARDFDRFSRRRKEGPAIVSGRGIGCRNQASDGDGLFWPWTGVESNSLRLMKGWATARELPSSNCHVEPAARSPKSWVRPDGHVTRTRRAMLASFKPK